MNTAETREFRKLVRIATAHGFELIGIYDGEEMEKPRSVKEAVEILNNLDDAHIHFRNYETGQKFWARLIMGNASDGSELIADHAANAAGEAIMDRFYA